MLSSTSSSRPRVPTLVRTIVLACLIAVCLPLVDARAANAPAGGARVTVNSTTVGGSTPSGFLGISIDYNSLSTFAGANTSKISTAFLNLLDDIGPGQAPVLRIGGESADSSWVPVKGQKRPPGVSFTITPAWLKLAAATAEGMHGKLLLGVNLEAGSKADTVGEAQAFLKSIGPSNILALELGNEPELYHHFPWYRTASGVPVFGRGANWSLSLYHAQFNDFAKALPTGATIAGPTSGLGTWLESLPSTLKAQPKIGLVTMHGYPLKHCSRSHILTIPEVLANAVSAGYVNEIATYVNDAHAIGKPLRLDEMNSISCGGYAGVSNSFASALWMMNTLFGLDRIGLNGLNLNVPTKSVNSVLAPVLIHGVIHFHVQPEYYSMIMFEQAAPPGSQILRLTTTGAPSTLQEWATRSTTGVVHVVLINKSASSSVSTAVRVPDAVGPAALSSLHANGLTSTGDVSLNGQSFGNSTTTGLLAGPAADQVVAPIQGTYTVKVPAASIEMLTFTPQPGSLLLSALHGQGLLSSLLPSW